MPITCSTERAQRPGARGPTQLAATNNAVDAAALTITLARHALVVMPPKMTKAASEFGLETICNANVARWSRRTMTLLLRGLALTPLWTAREYLRAVSIREAWAPHERLV
jgi:hypothetical protein